MNKPLIERWHETVRTRNADLLDGLLADEAVFYSPVVHTPQRGKQITKRYLSAALDVLCDTSFRYTREISEGNFASLEFEASIDDIYINGVDLIAWNDAGKITEFKVMVRPLKAIAALRDRMAVRMQSQQSQQQ